MLRFSWFSGFYENKATNVHTKDWDEFVTMLRALSNVKGYKPAFGELEKKFPLIYPAIYAEKTENGKENHRLNANVIGWDLIMVDIDDHVDDLQQIRDKFKPFNYIIYSSANCTKEKLTLRVCVPLMATAPKDQLHGIWWALDKWCDSILDTQTKDKSRMMYQPSQYTNKGEDYLHIFETNSGIDMDWKALCKKYPAPPEREKFKIVNPLRDLKRKVYLGSKKRPSFDIMNRDCPFVYPSMIDEYRLTPSGSHHGAIYKFMVVCCYNAAKINYPISVDELADMAKQVDDLDGSFYDNKKMLGSAVDALAYTCI